MNFFRNGKKFLVQYPNLHFIQGTVRLGLAASRATLSFTRLLTGCMGGRPAK